MAPLACAPFQGDLDRRRRPRARALAAGDRRRPAPGLPQPRPAQCARYRRRRLSPSSAGSAIASIRTCCGAGKTLPPPRAPAAGAICLACCHTAAMPNPPRTSWRRRCRCGDRVALRPRGGTAARSRRSAPLRAPGIARPTAPCAPGRCALRGTHHFRQKGRRRGLPAVSVRACHDSRPCQSHAACRRMPRAGLFPRSPAGGRHGGAAGARRPDAANAGGNRAATAAVARHHAQRGGFAARRRGCDGAAGSGRAHRGGAVHEGEKVWTKAYGAVPPRRSWPADLAEAEANAANSAREAQRAGELLAKKLVAPADADAKRASANVDAAKLRLQPHAPGQDRDPRSSPASRGCAR